MQSKISAAISESLNKASQSTASSVYEDLTSQIDKSQLECLNSVKEHPLSHALFDSGSSYLESDLDGQLLINIGFIAPVKVHHLVIRTPALDDKAPKTLKLFANKLNMDFSQAENDVATQEISLTKKELEGDADLKYVKFQNLKNITLFFQENQGGDTTRISKISLFGQSQAETDVKNIKKVHDE